MHFQPEVTYFGHPCGGKAHLCALRCELLRQCAADPASAAVDAALEVRGTAGAETISDQGARA